LYNGNFVFGNINWTYVGWDTIYFQTDDGSLIPVTVDLGEWVLKSGGKALTSGRLSFKTAQISSEAGSSFSLVVDDIVRGTSRKIDSEYTVGRKPMIYGNSKNIRVSIANLDTSGFRINSVSFEGNYNSRSKRI
jgi:hypothetical protein